MSSCAVYDERTLNGRLSSSTPRIRRAPPAETHSVKIEIPNELDEHWLRVSFVSGDWFYGLAVCVDEKKCIVLLRVRGVRMVYNGC